jgi:hypothetical protein
MDKWVESFLLYAHREDAKVLLTCLISGGMDNRDMS